MKNLVLPLLLLISIALSAQQFDVELDPNANFTNRTPAMDFLFQELRDRNGREAYTGETVGSPYLTDKFVKSKVFYDEELLGDFYVRFNAYNSEIEIKKSSLEEEESKRLLADKKISVKYGDKALRFTTYITKKGETKNGYLTLLYTGETYKLYKRLAVKYTEGKAAANSMVNPIPSKFTHFTEFYLKEKNTDRIDQIPSKTGKFLKSLGSDKREAIKAYIKKEGLDIAKEEDITKLITYLDELG